MKKIIFTIFPKFFILDGMMIKVYHGENKKKCGKKTERVFFNTAISMGLEVTDVRYFDRIAPYFVSHYLLMNEANILIPPYLDLTRKILIGCKDTVHTLRFEGTNIINNDLRPILDTKNERWYSNGK